MPSKDDKSILLSMHIWCKTEKLLDMYQRVSVCGGLGQDQVPGHYQRWTQDMVTVSHSQTSATRLHWSN